VIGGSAGIGLETARRARAEGAGIILTGRNPDRLERAATELGALSSAAFDATDPAALDRFFGDLPEAIDHVMVTGGGPYYARLADLDRKRAHRDFDEHLWLAVAVAQHAVGRVRPGGTLVFMGGTGGRARGPGLSLIAAGTAALPALIANLAVEVAPIRVNLIAAGFVDTPLSAALLGDDLDQRRDQLRATLPIRRVVGPADVAALAVHGQRVAIITGGSQGIGAGLVAGYRARGWAVVASARTIKPSEHPDVLAIEGDTPSPRPPTGSSTEHWNGSGASTPWSTTPACTSPSRSPTTPPTTTLLSPASTSPGSSG
jgi:NAD(P)-dependent dehydrogenase (short-subunit alcohol dehydrogenase family)